MSCCSSESFATCFPDSPAYPSLEHRYQTYRFSTAQVCPIDISSTQHLSTSRMNRIAVCVKDGEDGVTVVAVVPRGYVMPPYIPLGLTIPASVIYADCVAVAARVNCDGGVTSLGPPRDLPSLKSPSAPRRFDGQALKDAIALYGPFKSGLTQEYIGLFGLRILDRPYLMCVASADKTLELPFGHSVSKVAKIDWVAVTPLNFVPLTSAPNQDGSSKRPRMEKKDLNRLQHFLSWDWGENDSLLFSDAVDVCNVFPFGNTPVVDSDDIENATSPMSTWARSQRKDLYGNDWGRNLRQPFDDADVGQICTPFTRGFSLGAIFTVAPPRKSSSQGPNNTNINNTLSPQQQSDQQQPPPKSPSNNNEPLTSPTNSGSNNNNMNNPQSPPTVNERGAPSENVLFFFMMGTQHSGNPGPRFYGRGLNEEGQTGNDLVYQLVAWKYARNANNGWEVQWSRHCFLRGTVPIKFKSKVAKGIGEATLVMKEDAFDGSAEYLTQQVEKCDLISSTPSKENKIKNSISSTNDSDGKNEKSAVAASEEQVPNNNTNNTNVNKLKCINLLKSVSQAGEDRLGQHFDQSVKRLAATTGLPIDIEHIDWLGIEHKYGIDAAASRIWHVALLFLDGGGSSTSQPASCGSFPLQMKIPPTSNNTNNNNNNTPLVHIVTQQQNRYIRYNCADSLDRTNLASFFVIAQLCSRLFLLLDIVPERLELRVSANPSLYETAPTATKKLQDFDDELAEVKENLDELQEMPPETELPPCFYHSIQDFFENMPEPLMQALVELFITNGDTIAKLFTATGAIHTSHMRRFVTGMRSAPANAILSAQRRFENIFRDKKKYRVVDTLLGKDTRAYHFPTIPHHYLVWPLKRKEWPNALVIKIPGVTKLLGLEKVKKALFPDSVEKQAKIIGFRESILAIEKEISNNSVNNNSIAQFSQASFAAGGGGNPQNNNNNSNSGAAAVASPPTPGRGAQNQQQQQQENTGDDDVPKDQDNADFSFLTFERFYVAVILFDSPQIPASIMQSDAAASKIPFQERRVFIPFTVADQFLTAQAGFYLYDQATEETGSCLKVRQATEIANASSPLVKLSNFAKNFFK